MSSITKFFAISNQMLVSYSYDKMDTLGIVDRYNSKTINDYAPIIYIGLDGSVNYLTTRLPKNTKTNASKFVTGISYAKFEDNTRSTQKYFGAVKPYKEFIEKLLLSDNLSDYSEKYNNYVKDLSPDIDDEKSFYSDICVDILKAANSRGEIKSIVYPIPADGNSEVTDPRFWDIDRLINYDTIRIYLVSGYLFNNADALIVKMQTDRKYSVNSKLNLCNVIITKDQLKDCINWISNPLYMNSRFYDRYIEIPVPSIYQLSSLTNKIEDNGGIPRKNLKTYSEYLAVNKSTNITIQCAIVEKGDMTPININNMLGSDNKSISNFFRDKENVFISFDLLGSGSAITPYVIDCPIKLDSNSDYFGCRIETNKFTNEITYYPIFGDAESFVELNLDIMNSIEYGKIPMEDFANNPDDAFMDNEEFVEAYGLDARKWMIITEIAITYKYDAKNPAQNSESSQNGDYSYTETKVEYIDYVNKSSVDGNFWKHTLYPEAKYISDKELSFVDINIKMHLYNKMSAADIIRECSLVIDGSEVTKFYHSSKIIQFDAPINKLKVVNVLDNPQVSIIPNPSNQGIVPTKYIKSYYNVTDLTVMDSTNNYSYGQGQMILKLFRESHNYMFKLYTTSDIGTRMPYDLTGLATYYLSFPSRDGNKIKIYPDKNSSATELSAGTLVFNISESDVVRIMGVSDDDRYFAIICEGDGDITDKSALAQTTSVLYEGKVEYVN